MKNKKGISLIVLVITIIVIIILAGAVILSLANNNPIAQANEASFKESAIAYNSDLNVTLSSKYVQDFAFNPKIIYATSWDGTSNKAGTVKEYITSMTADDGKDYIIQQGKLIYIGTDVNKQKWSKDINLTDPIVKNGLSFWVEGSDVKNSPQTTSWIDRSGNNNNLTLYNFGYVNSSGSDVDNSIRFDGNNDYTSINNNAAINFGDNEFTVELTFKSNRYNENGLISHRSPGTVGSWWRIASGPTGIILEICEAYPSKYATSTVITDLSSKVHCTFVVKKISGIYHILTYRNGISIGDVNTTYTSINTDNTLTFDIGRWNTFYSNSNIYSLRLYKRALSDSEIMQNYNASM